MAFKPFESQDDNITDPGDLVSFEAFGTLANNINHLMDSMPIGSIIAVMVGLPGVPTPDPTIWQICDGADITNENSIIKGQASPNYADEGRYMRGYSNAGTIGNYGGQNDHDLTHNHGGTAGVAEEIVNGSTDDNNASNVQNHVHSMPMDLGVINLEPIHLRVNHYVKIR